MGKLHAIELQDHAVGAGTQDQQHVHFGSWTSASSLVRVTLRKNAGPISAQRAAFSDASRPHGVDFSTQFRKAIAYLQTHGMHSDTCKAECIKAARLLEQVGDGENSQQVMYSWEGFLGHPFPPNLKTIYHGAVSAFWFKRYVPHLAPRFTFIVRKQTDLIETVYMQEVRKRRFLDTFDVFWDRFVTGRDLSWLPVVEPFISRFGLENVQIVPFEEAARSGTKDFINGFCRPLPEFERETEARLVHAYADAKSPRLDFLGPERRQTVLNSVSRDNLLLFERYISAEYGALADTYQPDARPEGKPKTEQTWLDKAREGLITGKPRKLWVFNIDGHCRGIPMQEVSDICKNAMPCDYSGATVLLSMKDVNLPIPKGEPVPLKLYASHAGITPPGLRLDLISVNHDGLRVAASMRTDHGNLSATVTRGCDEERHAVLVRCTQPLDIRKLNLVLDMTGPSQLPTRLELSPNGVFPGGRDGVFASFRKPLSILPSKVSSVAAVSADERQIPRSACPELPDRRPFFLTIDTESFYFTRPTMITGEGLNGAKAVYEILDELDKHGLKAVFYVNVYEHLQYTDDAIERLCKDIHARDHEIALHCHKSDRLDFFREEIVNYDYDGQRRILEYGKRLILHWTGKEPVNFRAGGYQHTSETLNALQDLGFRIDSSYFYRHSTAPEHEGKFVQPYRIGKLIEVPVLYLPVVLSNGLISDRKFDINSVNLPGLLTTLEAGKAHLPVFSYMMHSFSFIKRQRFPKNHPSQDLMMRSPALNGSGLYMGVTSLLDDLWLDFCTFLENLANDDSIDVRTMAGAVDDLEAIVDRGPWPEVLPILYR